MWHLPWETDAWFEKLNAERDARDNDPSSGRDVEAPMMSNALSGR